MPLQIHQFICRTDNFGVLIHDPQTGATAALDAPDGPALLAALDARGWQLTDILITHKHADHVEGIPALKAKFPDAKVTGPAAEAKEIGALDVEVKEDDLVRFGATAAKVIATPGHTAGHIVYWFEEDDLLFAGDTLFALGCGRVFETSMEVMWESLSKLSRLPGETQVYCGHEYTLSNTKFALTIEPNNSLLQDRAGEIATQRAKGEMTLPTTIALELATNPFLRADEPAVKAALGMSDADASQVFAEIRERKNRA
ncbi:hydroxyacylglutathione hydrolase [Methylovirgula sp. 4M-Z18]|uniref:hydroxyacylglutathione hydrolase n=1 Tax=Methylovirgula sp. 4M-Z18 TaxID=2293567 RepID=UPI000E2F9354|nr:hydroxyacylglutathione hydrolase [Methylovirgula sp. 4M-Z18]RFB77986.1 hydroxyacylglutathione hydrolase [Methylovirgula sp. 4M-Z18]